MSIYTGSGVSDRTRYGPQVGTASPNALFISSIYPASLSTLGDRTYKGGLSWSEAQQCRAPLPGSVHAIYATVQQPAIDAVPLSLHPTALMVFVGLAILPDAGAPLTLLIAGSAGMASVIGVLWIFDRDVLRYLIGPTKRTRRIAG